MAKQALITGGTKGIGRAIAVCLAKAGYDLLLTYNTDETTAANLAAALRKDHAVKVDMLQADITQKESIDRIENRLNDSGVKLDALVLNAGTTYRTTFEEMNLAEWERQFFANVHFPVFLLQRIVGRMEHGAAVVFTGSLMGIEPHATSLSYGVTKSAVHALTRNLVKFLDNSQCGEGLAQTNAVRKDAAVVFFQLIDNGQHGVPLKIVERAPDFTLLKARGLVGKHILGYVIQKLAEDMVQRHA